MTDTQAGTTLLHEITFEVAHSTPVELLASLDWSNVVLHIADEAPPSARRIVVVASDPNA